MRGLLYEWEGPGMQLKSFSFGRVMGHSRGVRRGVGGVGRRRSREGRSSSHQEGRGDSGLSCEALEQLACILWAPTTQSSHFPVVPTSLVHDTLGISRNPIIWAPIPSAVSSAAFDNRCSQSTTRGCG